MTDQPIDLAALILRTERAAIAKAMCGQWTEADEAYLAALYADRRRLIEEGTRHV
jgi:hypothetical protein